MLFQQIFVPYGSEHTVMQCSTQEKLRRNYTVECRVTFHNNAHFAQDNKRTPRIRFRWLTLLASNS